MSVAKDQNGCRFLQRKFDEGGASAIAQVFPEILDNLTELMTDPFGNYLTQKLLDRCSEEQRLEVLPIHNSLSTDAHFPAPPLPLLYWVLFSWLAPIALPSPEFPFSKQIPFSKLHYPCN